MSSYLYSAATGTVTFIWSSIGNQLFPKKKKNVDKKIPVEKQKIKKVKGKKGVLYAFGTHKNTYKVGKTINLSQRMRSYRTIYPDGQEYHVIKCSDIHQSERILHSLLKMGGFHFKQEIFNVEGEVLKSYMNVVQSLDKMIEKEYSCEKMDKIVNFINNNQ